MASFFAAITAITIITLSDNSPKQSFLSSFGGLSMLFFAKTSNFYLFWRIIDVIFRQNRKFLPVLADYLP